jgi:demethylmenaquinone methyltransferase/2-methoxy-6-polyprenyl-1,4-benzoquinol methylase
MTERPLTLEEYYARRAPEYETAYDRSERQADIKALAEMLSTAFAGEEVLEVACGTGYWTRLIAKSAKNILATDINTDMLNIARQKDYGPCSVTFVESDAYSLANIKEQYKAGFHAFWWSHIPVRRIPSFLDSFHARLRPGAKVIMVDNSCVDGSSTPISRSDEGGNTYQIRRLQDGSEHEVLKNHLSPAVIRAQLQTHVENVRVTQLTYYWIAEYWRR